MTQILTDHENFAQYLFNETLKESNQCRCGQQETAPLRRTHQISGDIYKTDTIKMITNEDVYEHFAQLTNKMMTSKEQAER